MSSAESRKAARAQRRAQRKAARERRRRERLAAGLPDQLTATPDDPASGPASGPSLLPSQQLRRERVFALLEGLHTELVGARERQVLAQLGAGPGTDEYAAIARQIEGLNDEIDDLRELSDELLRNVAPLEVADDRLAQLEGMLGAARALAEASARATALIGAAQELLAAIDDALDQHA